MIKRVTERELVRQTVELAAHTRRKIEFESLSITDFEQVARLFDVRVIWGELPVGKDGSYLKDERKIILSIKITNPERINFTFCHEIMHARIEDDSDLLSNFADAFRHADEETMEQLCNAGAAELLMPSERMREYGCSVAHIPQLCENFGASSIAVAFQMLNCASHHCYLVIAEKRPVLPTLPHNQIALPSIKPSNLPQERLVIIYSGASPSASYSIKRNQVISADHLMYQALYTNELVQGNAPIPFATGKKWDVSCEAFYFRGKVFAFFNVREPVSCFQMSLF